MSDHRFAFDNGTNTESRLAPTAPVAWILCDDERLCRFFEIELAHLGLEVEAPHASERSPVLVIADTDAYPVESLLTEALPPACPLLAFGIRPSAVPEERGLYLHRPFPLGHLESALRHLSAAAVHTASPLGPFRAEAATRAGTPPLPSAEEPFLLSEDSKTVSLGDFSVTLTPAEWDILRHLYDRRGELVPREELADLLGGGGNSVEVYICHLRRKLEKPLGRRLIATVRGRGYRLS